MECSALIELKPTQVNNYVNHNNGILYELDVHKPLFSVG